MRFPLLRFLRGPSLADALLRRRRRVLVVGLALCTLLALGMGRLEFQNDYRSFLSPDNPEMRAFEAMERVFAQRDNLLVAVAPASGDVFTVDSLAAIAALTREAWGLPGVARVDSLTNFPRVEVAGDAIVLREMLAEGALPADLTELRKRAMAEPELVGRLLSPEGQVAGVNILVTPSADAGARLLEALDGLLLQLRQAHPDLRFAVSGVLAVNAAFNDATRRDLLTVVPLGFVLLLATIRLSTGSTVVSAVVLAVAALAGVAAMGVAGWLGLPLTPMLGAAPVVILSICVADGVHLLLAVQRHRAAGADTRGALGRSLEENALAVFLTSLTTALGMLGLNFSDSPPFRDLGNIAALGTLFGYLLSMFWLPAALGSLPPLPAHAPSSGDGPWTRLTGLAERRPRAVLAMFAVVVLAALPAIVRNDLNDNLVQYFDRDTRIRQDTDFIDRHLNGVDFIDFALTSGAASGIADPGFLADLERFRHWLESQPEVTHVSAIDTLVRRLNQVLHGDEPAWYRIPLDAGAIAQYLLVYELLLSYGQDLNDRIDVRRSATRVTASLRSATSTEFVALEQRALHWAAQNAPGVSLQASGPALVFAHLSERNIRQVLAGTFLALGLIAVALLPLFRTARMGLIALVPNLLPSLLALSLWGLTVGRIGVSLSVVAVMTLGIVVDDSIHFLLAYRAARRAGADADGAVARACRRVGPAMSVTSLAMIAGLLVLMGSSFEANAQLGQLAGIMIALALLLDLLLLPALLLQFDRSPAPYRQGGRD
jgi:predicted RND superfamily exporter protein